MQSRGRHLLCEYRGCAPGILDDRARVEELLVRAATAAGATVVGCLLHDFPPRGVSGVIVVEESHLSIHTWPEEGYAAVDFYTCGDCCPEAADAVLREGLQAAEAEVMAVDRGLPGIRVRSHEAAPPRRLTGAGPR